MPELENSMVEIESFSSIYDVNIPEWNDIVLPYFYAHTDHLGLIENVQKSNQKFLYFMVKINGKYQAAFYFQYVLFSFKNAVENFKIKNDSKCNIVYPFLSVMKNRKVPLLHSGNVFFTEDNGMYFSPELNDGMKSKVIESVCQYISKKLPKIASSSIVLSGFRKSSGTALEDSDFYTLEIEPNLIMRVQDRWKVFEDYVEDLSAKYRQRVKKVMSKTEGISIRILNRAEIESSEPTLWELYKNVADHANFNLAYLGKRYFTAMKDLYLEDFEVKAYYWKDKMVGFSSAFYKDSQQFVHFIGLDYNVNQEIPLYHRMLFEFVKDSIQKKHQWIHLGRTATEIKTTIGAEPVDTYNCIRFGKSWMFCVLPKMIHKFGAKPFVTRRPFKQLDEVSVE